MKIKNVKAKGEMRRGCRGTEIELTHWHTRGGASKEAEDDQDGHGLGDGARDGEDAEEAHRDEVDELATDQLGKW